MNMRETEINTSKYDFILDNIGYTEEPLDQRAFIFCKILNELNIPFKKYYTSSQHRYLRSKPYSKNNDFADMGMVLVGNCDENYAKYAIYLYKQKMEVLCKLNKML